MALFSDKVKNLGGEIWQFGLGFDHFTRDALVNHSHENITPFNPESVDVGLGKDRCWETLQDVLCLLEISVFV